MKKTLLSIAFIAAGIFAFNAAAQEACCNPAQACCNPAQTCCQTPGKPGKAARPAKQNALEGITLTPEQQTAVNALNEKYAAQRKAKMQSKKESRDKERSEAKNGRKEYLNEMKAILTPEQYTTYLENLATQQQQRPKMHVKGDKVRKAGKDAKIRKGDQARKDNKSRKGARKATVQPAQPTAQS